MRINAIRMPEDIKFKDGLKPVMMERLQHMVVIAGQNGSGKSRLLRRVSQLTSIMKRGRDANVEEHERRARQNPSREDLRKMLEDAVRSVEAAKWFDVTGNEKQLPQVINFIPRGLNLSDPFHQSQQTVRVDIHDHNRCLGMG